MISEQNLKNIAANKLDASKILFSHKKFDASIYLVGYAIEISLKYKICKILKLDDGFPETKQEFKNYIEDSNNDLGAEITKLEHIRNHDLQKLLFYSGQEVKIKAELLDDWTNISFWKPELRYSINFTNEQHTKDIIYSVEKILNLILK